MTAEQGFPAGRLVMVNIQGTHLDQDQARFLREHRIRAVCLFRGNLVDEAQVRRLTADLRELMGPGALIALDQEGGAVVRASFLPQPPAAMALGAANDAHLAEAVGAAVARGVASLGFNWNFAPVLDVNSNPANPVIAERSFSQDPQQVARLAGAWMRGATAAAVASCVKHFPGHGDTHVDSHLDLPVVDKPLERLRRTELLPFELLQAAAPAIMTAHIVYPQIDAQYPATLSPRVIGGLLRESMGYRGVVITDSLVMKAIYERFGHERAAVLALQAGADMVMALGSQAEQAAAVGAIDAAVASADLPAAALRASLERLDALAQRFPVRWPLYLEEQRRADESLMRHAWALGLTGIGSPVAPEPATPLRVVTQSSVPTDGISEAGISGEQVLALFQGFSDVEPWLLEDLGHVDWSAVPRDHRRTVLVSNHRQRYVPPGRLERPDLHLVLWNPFQAIDVDAPTVVTWGYGDGALLALRHWLAGETRLHGIAPVDLEPAC